MGEYDFKAAGIHDYAKGINKFPYRTSILNVHAACAAEDLVSMGI